MFKKIIKWYLERKAKMEQKNREKIYNQIFEEYNIIEKHGNVYIMAGSRVAAKIEQTTTVAEVVEILNKIRTAQIEYKKVEN